MTNFESQKTKHQKVRFSEVPHKLTLNPAVSEDTLVMLAMRGLFVGDRYAFNEHDIRLGITLPSGQRGIRFCRNRYYKAQREAQELGFLERSQPKRGRHVKQYAQEQLKMPSNRGGYQRAYEDLFDGSLTSRQVAVLLFIRANLQTYANKIAKRFGFSIRVAQKVLRELSKYITSYRPRNPETGRLGNRVYLCKSKAPYAQAEDAQEHRESASDAQMDIEEATYPEKVYPKRACPKRADTLRKNSPRTKNCSRRSPNGDYVSSQANDTHPHDFCFQEVFEIDRLLGWMNSIDQSDYKNRWQIEQLKPFGMIDEVEGGEDANQEDLEAVAAVYSVDEHIALLKTHTENRVHFQVASPAGAAAIVRIAAGVMTLQPHMPPRRALQTVYDEIERQFGAERKAWMNSLKLVTCKLANTLHKAPPDSITNINQFMVRFNEMGGCGFVFTDDMASDYDNAEIVVGRHGYQETLEYAEEMIRRGRHYEEHRENYSLINGWSEVDKMLTKQKMAA